MRLRKIVLPFALALLVASCSRYLGNDALLIGAVYPTGGGQGQGGVEEFRGAQLAAALINLRGGVNGRTVELKLAPADSSDQAPRAVRSLIAAGVPAILGSYGSTISKPAADLATSEGRVFWETGAVGELGMVARSGDMMFRFAPTGTTLGTSAVGFMVEQLLPKMDRAPASLRFGVTYVDDVYGRSVGLGAVAELRKRGLQQAGPFPYDLLGFDARKLVRAVKAAKVDVLIVSAYLEDAIAMRKAMIAQRLKLVASIGTSSSYCMHLFGEALGQHAVGLFASDKPDGDVLDPSALAPEAGEALRWARDTYRNRWGDHMGGATLTGFSGAWALFNHVLPNARAMTPAAIADAARSVDVALGGLPNGSGLRFASGVENDRATSVIWEWVKPRTRAIVWPRIYATSPIVPLPIA